jgi:hypothetical protein
MWRMMAVVLLGLAPSSQALAWGKEGHRIVCQIAFDEASPTTRDAISALIASDPTFHTFAESCVWPDDPRQRPEEHFVDVPRYAQAIVDYKCPLAETCVLGAIALDFGRLKLPEAGPAGHLEALKFLGHWVGDVHQPLHVSFDDDRGANSITTVGTCQGTLHSAWDSCLLKQAVSITSNASGVQLEQQLAAAVAQLEQEITDANRADWITTGSVDWANESLTVAEAPATGYCVKTADLCAYEAGNVALDVGEAEKTVTIDAAYVAMSTPIVRDRLKRAGVRLAHLLDEALAE